MSLNLCFLGAGNLATHLSKVLQERGFHISQVYSRSEKSAKDLAQKLDTSYTTFTNQINNDADVYIVALKDAVFDEVLSQIDFRNKLLVHCSGSMPLSALTEYSGNIGVFYPLQTFSKSREVDFKSIPVFIEANSKNNEDFLVELAQKITDSVSIMNSEKRKFLHISAVFACNFVNHFYAIAAELLKSKDIPFDVLKPLILETAQKVMEIPPQEAQTGPAVRFDENIISDHLNEISDFKNYAELYNSISKSIFEHHQNLK